MKSIFSIILIFLISASALCQQIGGGFAPLITDFTIPLKSGFYNAINPNGLIPDNSYDRWQHLLTIRHPNENNDHQLQIASSFAMNDRLFFRKIAGGLESINPTWIELATRGTNTFIGNQSIDGNQNITGSLSVGRDTEIAMISGPTNCGAIQIKSHSGLGGSLNRYLRLGFKDNNSVFYPALSINDDLNVGIGTTTPSGSLEITKLNSDLVFDLNTNGLCKMVSKGWNANIDIHTFQINGVENVNQLYLNNNGNVGIGSTNPDSKLTVKGKIHAEEVKVDLAVPADYVFEKYYLGQSALKPDYTLLTLSEVEKFTEANHHLPNVPSAKDIKENGLLLGEMSNVLLQKVEELTLYIIEQNKRIEKLEMSNH